MTRLLAKLLILLAGHGGPPQGPPPAARALSPARPVPRILCQHPPTLELRRFEDRSAQVVCDGRVLARIAVPG